MLSHLRNLLFIASLLVVSFLFTGRMSAQSTGNIRGTVNDATGAVVPGAAVTITNPGTGFTRTEQSNDSGLFVFPDLPIGTYNITIAKAGFQTQKRPDTELLTGQTIGIEAVLVIGAQTETIEVSSDTQQIKTASSEISTSVDEKQMQDLPINSRNPLQLTTLTPGAALTTVGTESGQQDNVGLTVNGLRPTQNNYQLDGAIYINRFFDSVPILPNPDALREFTIQAANFSAEYAGAGALVQLSTRSGANTLHGSAFEFFRNTVLNARSYFTRSPTPINPFKQNQFGGTIGGPIVIPHLYSGKDKTFFFFSAEDLQRRSSPNSSTIILPTAAQLSGNFGSVNIHDPTTGIAYAGNQITQPINPVSKAVAAAFITPLYTSASYNPATGAYVTSPNTNIDSTQYLLKVDHRVTAHNQFSARYFYNEDNFQRAFAAPLGFFAANNFRNQSLNLSDTQILSNTLTATFYANAGRFARTQVPVSPGLQNLQTFGANLPYGTNGIPVFPGIRANISGYVNIFSGGALTQDPTSFEFKGQAVKILGNHSIGFGFTYERTRIDAVDFSYTPGDNTFNGQRTGNAVADFYLGLDSNFFQDNGRKFYLRENRFGLYVQDDWKLTRELTVNLGLRWDPWLPPSDLNQTLVGFNAGQQSTVAPNAPLGLVFQGDAGIVPSIFHKNYKDFAPRVGFAYNVGGKGSTVVRAGYGLFYGFPEGLLYQRTDAAQPIDLYLNIVNPPSWDNIYAGFPGGDPFPRAHFTTSQFKTYNFITPFSGGVLNPNAKVGYTQDYNVTVEQQLPFKLFASLSWIGNHSVHIMGSRQFNPAVCAPGAPCTNLNNSTCATCTAGNENSRRLYPGLGAVELADSYEYELYNALQFNVTRRVAKGMTILTNFTWSKAIDNTSSAIEGVAGPPNPFNLNSARGPADYDQKFRYNTAINYLTPAYRGGAFGKALLNGYAFNLVANLYSGFPFTVLSGTDRSLSGIGNDYADVVPGVNPHATTNPNRLAQYFNPAAFAPAALGTFGNSSRNSLRGPGYQNIDVSVFKDLFTESRIHGQFRAEGFNIINHPNFANPNSTVSTAATDGVINNVVSNTSANVGPRVFQFGAKIIF